MCSVVECVQVSQMCSLKPTWCQMPSRGGGWCSFRERYAHIWQKVAESGEHVRGVRMNEGFIESSKETVKGKHYIFDCGGQMTLLVLFTT